LSLFATNSGAIEIRMPAIEQMPIHTAMIVPPAAYMP
jgi:hypothetical protein